MGAASGATHRDIFVVRVTDSQGYLYGYGRKVFTNLGSSCMLLFKNRVSVSSVSVSWVEDSPKGSQKIHTRLMHLSP